MKWIVMWVDHAHQNSVEEFDSEQQARDFIMREGTENCFKLWRAELIEDFR